MNRCQVIVKHPTVPNGLVVTGLLRGVVVADAEAICEAMNRPNMRFVKVKTVEQQDLQALHRVLSELKSHRKGKANQIRGLVAEYGLVAPRQLGYT